MSISKHFLQDLNNNYDDLVETLGEENPLTMQARIEFARARSKYTKQCRRRTERTKRNLKQKERNLSRYEQPKN